MEPPKPGPKRQSTLAFSPEGILALADDAPPPAKSPAATREAASRLKTKPHQGLYVDKNKPDEHNDELREGEDLDDADEEPRLEPERVVVLDETEDENYVDSPETDGKEENGEAQSSGSAEFDESEEDEVEELETVASRAAGRRTAASGSTAKTGREEGRITPVASGSGTRREKKDDAATPGPAPKPRSQPHASQIKYGSKSTAPSSSRRSPPAFTLIIPLRRQSKAPAKKKVGVIVVSSSEAEAEVDEEQKQAAEVKSLGGRKVVVDSEDDEPARAAEESEEDLGPVPYPSAVRKRKEKEIHDSKGKGKALSPAASTTPSPPTPPPKSKAKPKSKQKLSQPSSSSKRTVTKRRNEYEDDSEISDSTQDEPPSQKKKARPSLVRNAKASSSKTGKGRRIEDGNEASSEEDEREKKRRRQAKGKGKAARSPPPSSDSSEEERRPVSKKKKTSKVGSGKIRSRRREESEDDLELSGKETILADRLRVLTPKDKFAELKAQRAKNDAKRRGVVLVASESDKSGTTESSDDSDSESASDSGSPVQRAGDDLNGFILSDGDEEVAQEVDEHLTALRQKNQPFKFYVKSYLAWLVHIMICPDIDFHNSDDKEYKTAFDRVTLHVEGILNSLVSSSVWKVPFKLALNQWPMFEIDAISAELEGVPCDACATTARHSHHQGTFSGDKYNPKTFAPIPADPENSDSDSDSDASESGHDPPREFNLGRFCAGRAQAYHELRHCGYWFYQQLVGKVKKYSKTYPKPSYTGMSASAKKKAKLACREKRLVEASRVVGILEEAGIIPKIAKTFEERLTKIQRDYAT